MWKLPVLVEATTAFFRQMLSPDLDQWTATEWCFDVSNSTNNHNWWSFNDGDGFNNFFLVDFCFGKKRSTWYSVYWNKARVPGEFEIGKILLRWMKSDRPRYSSWFDQLSNHKLILKGFHHRSPSHLNCSFSFLSPVLSYFMLQAVLNRN